MTYTVRPISDRTAFTGVQRNSPFLITYTQLMHEFDRELDFLNARDVVLEVDVDERHIRADGTLRADAKTHTPAVRLAFASDQGPLVYATDAFERVSWRRSGMQQDWQHNLCAIIRGLEALRRLDRYGITRRGEQYAGWKALPAGRAMPASHMTRDQALQVLRDVLGYFDADLPADSVRREIRKARACSHPDRHGGDHTLWNQVEQAALVLGVDR